ncbi:MAG: WYL domain-containing protein [Bacillaceae bacterium]|nr:WYL domain-containing protein [Bacillaceae bacterium]
MSDITSVIQGGKSTTKIENNPLPEIIEAILASRTIKAIYHTQSRDARTERKIDPYYLIPREHRLYVIGYCHKTKEIRTFRLSRFHQVEILEETYTKDDLNMQRYFDYTWSIIGGDERIHFKVRFSSEVARYIIEEDYVVKPKLTIQKDGSLLFEVILNDGREFLKWVMQHGPDAEILEPIKYRVKMQKMLQRWSGIYQ